MNKSDNESANKLTATDTETGNREVNVKAATSSELSQNRNSSYAQPKNNEELADNLAGADSGLEKPRGQER